MYQHTSGHRNCGTCIEPLIHTADQYSEHRVLTLQQVGFDAAIKLIADGTVVSKNLASHHDLIPLLSILLGTYT